jgi:hypothetical protein
MKKFLITTLFWFFGITIFGQVGINTLTPHGASVLDINGQINPTTFGGFLPPRLSETQRDAIALDAAADGLLVYVTKTNGDRCLQMYDGINDSWGDVRCFIIPPTAVNFLETTGSISSETTVNPHQTASGFDNNANGWVFNSTGANQVIIRDSAPISTEFSSSASGGAYMFFADGSRNVTISNMDLTAFPGTYTLSLLIYKSGTNSNTDGQVLTFEYSTDNGATWTVIPLANYLLPTGAGTPGWYNRILSSSLPNTTNQFRISRVAGGGLYQIDDIRIESN